MQFILELKVVKRPENYGDYFDINRDGCCLYGMSGTLLCCDRCPTNYLFKVHRGDEDAFTRSDIYDIKRNATLCYEHFTLDQEMKHKVTQIIMMEIDEEEIV